MKNRSNSRIKRGLALGLIAGTAISIGYIYRHPSQNSSFTPKEQQWQAKEKEVNSWGDALGMGIDESIKNTVIVLNLLGFKTIQSCEGHLNWGRPYPWIMISVEDTKLTSLIKDYAQIFNDITENQGKAQLTYPDLPLGQALEMYKNEHSKEAESLDDLYKKSHSLNDEIEKLSRGKIVGLRELLFSFYKKSPADPDTMLTLNILGRDIFELYSIGGNWQITYEDSEKVTRLKKYQEEMKRFTDFLTDYYFSKF